MANDKGAAPKRTRKVNPNREPRSLYIVYSGEGEVNIKTVSPNAKEVLKATMQDKSLKLYEYVPPKKAATEVPAA